MINQTLKVWENYPGVQVDGFEPILTTYILGGNKARGLVLILPGGGYGFTSPREAEPIALKFNSAGYHAIVLDYSCAPNRFPMALYDCGRALTIIKEHSECWRIDLAQLYVCGFSAGGHLAASISNKYLEPVFSDVEGIDLEGLKLRGSILSYPVITAGEFRHKGSFDNLIGESVSEDQRLKHSMEDLVHQHTPETFIWHTVNDQSVPVENTMLYIKALQKQGISYECHLYPNGPHGISLATEETADNKQQINSHVASWMRLCCDWMDSHKS